MGTVHTLATHETATVAEACDAYLATLARPESAGTRRVYSGVLRALAKGLGPDTDVAELKPRAVAAWFTGRRGERSPSRWNVALDALRSASRYWAGQGWVHEDPARLLRRRRKAPDRSRAWAVSATRRPGLRFPRRSMRSTVERAFASSAGTAPSPPGTASAITSGRAGQTGEARRRAAWGPVPG